MNNASTERLSDIKNLLAEYPRGLSVNEISAKLHRHRNSVSRDLHALSLSGQVIQHAFGTTRIYSLAQRPPISKILHYTSDMALILGSDGTIVTANSPLLAYLGCSFEELEGRYIHEKTHPLLHAISTHLAGDNPPGAFSASTHTITTEKGVSHLKIKKIPTVFDDGTSGSVFMIEDITGEILARNNLETSEAMYRAIVEGLNEMVIRFLPGGTTIFANRAYTSYFSSSPVAAGEESFFARVFPDDIDRIRSGLASLTPECPMTGLSLRVVPAGGAPAWNAWTFLGLFDQNAELIVYQGIGQDITPEMEAREQEAAHLKEMDFLSLKVKEFQGIGAGDDMYSCIAGHIAEMMPGADVTVFATGPSESLFTMTARNPDPRGEGCPSQGIPFAPGSCCQFHDDDPEYASIRNDLLSGMLVDTGSILCRSCLRPQAGSGSRDTSEGEMCGYSAGLTSGRSLIGAIEISSETDLQIPRKAFMEGYLRIATLALQRWITGKTLATSEERFMKIATTSPLPISVIDQSGRYTYVSPTFTTLFGYTLDDIPTGRDWFMHAFPDLAEQKTARDLWKKDRSEGFAGGSNVRQFRVRCRDGIFKEISFLPVSISDGQNLVMYEDVTPRVEAIQTRNLLSDIFRCSHDGIFSATIDGRVLSWNPAAERIYGYTAGEVEGKDVRMLEPPHLKGEIASILERVRNGEYIVKHETQRLRKDGRLIDVSLTISPVFEEGGGIMGASTIIRDITAQKAEERLRNVEMKYQGLVDNINVGVYRSTGDPRGRFIWGNTSLLRILGYKSLDDLKDVAVSDLFARARGREELLVELRQHGFVKNMEITLRRTDGTVVHVLVTALATFNPDGSISHINGIVEDITGQRILEEKVAQLCSSSGHDPHFLPVL